MPRAALLTLPALILLAAGALAGDPAPGPSPTPAKSKLAAKKAKAAAEAKDEKTSPALEQLFDKDPIIRHPEVHMWGAAEMSVTAIRR
jgi:hypothetical protein